MQSDKRVILRITCDSSHSFRAHTYTVLPGGRWPKNMAMQFLGWTLAAVPHLSVPTRHETLIRPRRVVPRIEPYRNSTYPYECGAQKYTHTHAGTYGPWSGFGVSWFCAGEFLISYSKLSFLRSKIVCIVCIVLANQLTSHYHWWSRDRLMMHKLVSVKFRPIVNVLHTVWTWSMEDIQMKLL